MSDRVTVVLMGWKRVKKLTELAWAYDAMSAVAQVIVMNNNRHEQWVPPGPDGKIQALNATCDFGMASRFAAATLARTNFVLLADDDIMVPEHTITALGKTWDAHPGAGCVGLFGRRPALDGTYDIKTVYGKVPIVLTRAVLTSRRLCALAANNTQRMAEYFPTYQPYGTGEDIVLSYTALALTGKLNVAVAKDYTDHDAKDANSISVRYTGHEARRTEIVRWCRRELSAGGLEPQPAQ